MWAGALGREDSLAEGAALLWVATALEWLPERIPVFLPGEFHGQRSLEGYDPWGRRVRCD